MAKGDDLEPQLVEFAKELEIINSIPTPQPGAAFWRSCSQ
jgi:hypothetical protein